MRRSLYGYHRPYQYWHHPGWHQAHYQQYPYGDDSSVHSALSTDYSEYGVYGGAAFPPMYHHPHMQGISQAANVGYDPNIHGAGEAYIATPPYHPDAGLGFFGQPPVNPNTAYGLHSQLEESVGEYYGMPQTPKASSHGLPTTQQLEDNESEKSPQENAPKEQSSPLKYDPSKTPSRSPYWGHLDSTIAMGLSTPQTHGKGAHANFISPEEESEADGANASQPLYQYGYAHPSQNVSKARLLIRCLSLVALTNLLSRHAPCFCASSSTVRTTVSCYSVYDVFSSEFCVWIRLFAKPRSRTIPFSADFSEEDWRDEQKLPDYHVDEEGAPSALCCNGCKH